MSDLPALSNLIESCREIATFQSMEELLHWDQRTGMPPKAAAYRADQITTLSGLIHEKLTSPQRGEWLNELRSHPELESDPDAAVIVARLTRQYDKEIKVPKRLVEELARARVLAHESWVEARRENDFSRFSGKLAPIIDLLKEKTEAIGYTTCPYDVLLDDFEPDAQTSEVQQVFDGLRDQLVPLLETIRQSGHRPDTGILHGDYDVQAQRELGIEAATAIGFDFQAGRLDETHHPFCCTLGPDDCRITTRYDRNFFSTAFFGTLHEAGHGLYEQGLRKDQFGLPTGEYCSLGIHESQSRLWENMVGRSLAFWRYFFPRVQKRFPTALQATSCDDFFAAVNDVQPSLIRVEADEATYSLHVIIRFELEQEIFSGKLTVSDLPDAWNEKYRDYLGVQSETAGDGVLQDVHWSEALFGYFPTYALGNLYAAQFFQAASRSLGNLEADLARGEFRPLLDWLREHVHGVGKSLSAGEILQAATGESLSHEPLIDYLRQKYTAVFDIHEWAA